jgi:protein O-GlcNAc transferase
MSRLDVQSKFQRAITLHQAGNLPAAEQLYREIISVDPKHSNALHYLGLVVTALGNYPQARELLDRSLALEPSNLQFIENYATTQFQIGDYQSALDLAERGLKRSPANVSLLYIGAISLLRMKRFQESLTAFDKVLSLAPDHAAAINERGSALAELKDYDAALACFGKALSLQRAYPEAHLNQANVLGAMERYDEAVAAYDKALALKPDLADAWVGRGNALAGLEKYEAATAAYDKAMALKPNLAEAWLGRGNILDKLRRHDEALIAYDKSVALKGDLAEAWLGRANMLSELRRYEEALFAYDNAVKLRADLAQAWLGRGNMLSAFNRYEAAFPAYEKAVALKPDLNYATGAKLFCGLNLCNWQNLQAEVAQLLSMMRSGRRRASMPFYLLPIPSSAEDQLQCARAVAADYAKSPEIWAGQIYRHDRIRVAYLSGDFGEHAVAYLTAGLFERHDKSRFELTALSIGPAQESPTRERIKSAFEHFVDLQHESDAAIAALIRQREIDIAVDLMGFTGRNRLGILARRAAPIQVNYLGYAATTGASYSDYIIADATVIPEDQAIHYSERVVWLPNSFLVSDNRRKISDSTPTRRECGLPEDAFVFCCFNNSYKLAPDTFDIWMRLLKANENGVLWLSSSNATAEANLRQEAERRGVSSDRLIFAAKVPEVADHLSRQRRADLFLDTYPYNAHSTASDALWAGVPLLTRLGDTFASRVAASLLTAIGLEELVTHSVEEYEALALRLAQNPSYLASLRRQLEHHRQTHPLFDTERTTREIEAAYTMMWRRYQSGDQLEAGEESRKPLRVS